MLSDDSAIYLWKKFLYDSNFVGDMMNVDDIKEDVIPTDFSQNDKLDLIFIRQHSLVDKYLPIEKKNGLLQTADVPVNLDDKFGQARLKDFFWRVTEELTESVDAARIHSHIHNHALEEMADALHFLVEACILSGIEAHSFNLGLYQAQPDLLPDGITNNCKLDLMWRQGINWHDPARKEHATFETYVYEIIHAVGCASNCLKQRPWKQTHQATDKPKYTAWMLEAMKWLIQTFKYLEMTPDQIFRMYWKKSEVNKFRQRSNY